MVGNAGEDLSLYKKWIKDIDELRARILTAWDKIDQRIISRSRQPPPDRKYMGAAILDPPSWILVMFQLKIISF